MKAAFANKQWMHEEENNMNLKWKKPLAMLLVVCMLLTILPVAAFAEGEPPVAQIGNAQYNTLQEAVTAAGKRLLRLLC